MLRVAKVCKADIQRECVLMYSFAVRDASDSTDWTRTRGSGAKPDHLSSYRQHWSIQERVPMRMLGMSIYVEHLIKQLSLASNKFN
jgi:hypothetical protein